MKKSTNLNMKSKIFSFFHLNLLYSAIEIEDRPKVIDKCYWPLLNIAKKYNLPFGIELSGFTLEEINKLDPSWVIEFKKLLNSNVCELIGCGYSQIIGPLVPAKVNKKNLSLGDETYREILGVKPTIALVNEQAFSKGLITNYIKNGYEILITEWENSARLNTNWDEGLSYFSQNLKNSNGSKVKLIWNKSINFQKFQRYVHGEYSLREFSKYVTQGIEYGLGAFPLYGNDVEIFDYRPGRYMTESKINYKGEWQRIDDLFNFLINELKCDFIKTSEVINLRHKKHSNNIINLTCPSEPIPVKKQEKYNIVRWAVSGRNDLKINSDCYKIFEGILDSKPKLNSNWKELCYLWSSDFRTHITDKRWLGYNNRLENFKNKIIRRKLFKKKIRKKITFKTIINEINRKKINSLKSNIKLKYENNFIKIEGKRLLTIFNCYRGLAIESFTDKNYSNSSLIGTIHHGFFDDIKFSADYYSGHIVFETPGKHKITDLNLIEPILELNGCEIIISTSFETKIGIIYKSWVINDTKGNIKLNISFEPNVELIGSLRLGYITLIPGGFSSKQLFYKTHNGGVEEEKFYLSGTSDFDHGRNISSLISTNQALGITDGKISIGDHKKKLNLIFNKSDSALIGLISHQNIKNKFLTRLALSAKEIDDTSKPTKLNKTEITIELFMSK